MVTQKAKERVRKGWDEHVHMLEAIATSLEAIATRLEAITTSNKKLVGWRMGGWKRPVLQQDVVSGPAQ